MLPLIFSSRRAARRLMLYARGVSGGAVIDTIFFRRYAAAALFSFCVSLLRRCC